VFPASYLRGVRYPTETAGLTSSGTAQTTASETTGTTASGTAATSSVVLRCSRAYDFSNVAERGAWLDVLVALVLYLQSGDSRVGYLSKTLRRNRLHKRVDEAEAQAEAENVQAPAEVEDLDDEDSDEDSEMEMEMEMEEAPEVAPRRLSRKRSLETTPAPVTTAAAVDEMQIPPKFQRRRKA